MPKEKVALLEAWEVNICYSPSITVKFVVWEELELIWVGVNTTFM